MRKIPTDITIFYGFWSSLLFTITGILYGISMGILLSTYKIPTYISVSQFLSAVDDRFINIYSLCQLFAFLSVLFYMILLISVYGVTEESNKLYIRLSICFGLPFMILASLNYFIQFTVVRLSILKNTTQNIDIFIQFNPLSFAYATNMLAWSLFLGLSSFFLSFIFKESKIGLTIKISLLLTSLFCLLGMIGTVFDLPVFMFLFQMGMTLGLTVSAVLITIFFYRKKDLKWQKTKQLKTM